MLMKVNIADIQDPAGLTRTGYVRVDKIIAILPQRINIQTQGKSIPVVGKEVTMVMIEGGVQLPVVENVETFHQQIRKAMGELRGVTTLTLESPVTKEG